MEPIGYKLGGKSVYDDGTVQSYFLTLAINVTNHGLSDQVIDDMKFRISNKLFKVDPGLNGSKFKKVNYAVDPFCPKCLSYGFRAQVESENDRQIKKQSRNLLLRIQSHKSLNELEEEGRPEPKPEIVPKD